MFSNFSSTVFLLRKLSSASALERGVDKPRIKSATFIWVYG